MDVGEILSVCALFFYFILLAVLFCGWYFYLRETKRTYIRHRRDGIDEESYDGDLDFSPCLATIGIKNESIAQLEEFAWTKNITKIA